MRPLRSKHCSVQKRCVSCFDHFCPYVNNTMGSRNYKYFILFMAFGLVGVSMTAVACVQYLLLIGRHKWILFQVRLRLRRVRVRVRVRARVRVRVRVRAS